MTYSEFADLAAVKLHYLAGGKGVLQQQQMAMASFTLHVLKVKPLPSGEHLVQVSLINEKPVASDKPVDDAVLESVTLSTRSKNVERLENPDFVNKDIQTWFASRGGKWDKVNIQKYFEHILKS